MFIYVVVLPLRQRKVRKSSVLGLRRDRSWMEEDRDEEESDEREEEGTVARLVVRLPGSATLTGVVLGELGCDWANFLWAWSRGLSGRQEQGEELMICNIELQWSALAVYCTAEGRHDGAAAATASDYSQINKLYQIVRPKHRRI